MCKPRRLAAAGLVLAAGLMMFGCTGPGEVSEKPAIGNGVAAAEQALTLAERIALRYTSLPQCGGAAKLCHDPAIKAKIKALDNTAFNAVMAARNNEALLSVAVSAIGNLSAAIPGGN